VPHHAMLQLGGQVTEDVRIYKPESLWWRLHDNGYLDVTKPDGSFNGPADPRERMAQRMEETARDMRRAIQEDRKSGPWATSVCAWS
jgi:hypothetical protein